MANIEIDNGIINDYIKRPSDITEFAAFRGVTDFTRLEQFSLFETGYSYLFVISIPKFLKMLADEGSNTEVSRLIELFKHTLEYEFKGLSGLPDISTDTATIDSGTQQIQMINKVNEDSTITVTMQFYEKLGSPITKISEYYLTGIKDKRTQAKTYHGLIKRGKLKPGYENEIFTFLYVVTDNTYLEIEKSVLLANAQLTKCENIYDSQKGDIGHKELSVEFNCLPLTGQEVDRAAKTLLQRITGVSVSYANKDTKLSVDESVAKPIVLDSAAYDYVALNEVRQAAENA